MGRPALPVGTWGDVSAHRPSGGKWRARTLYRDTDHVTREVSAVATTEGKARSALRLKLADRKREAARSGDLTRRPRSGW